ncbi:MAG: hypothetical protein KF760_17965 [Candidatus Eremiobacteraeota bacterium]|nr:hypothetical protein [Candidatus Eremiobacteraeota bacterium]MCW5871220.1 hypothetical protein [Candidatus Eremiobacteraeota bacterium]
MSKNAIIGIIVLCFVSTFMTMVYQYASRGYLHESNPPISGSGGHAVHAEGGHEGADTPGPAVDTPMSVAETPAAPTATETPGEAPVDTPSTPIATPVP